MSSNAKTKKKSEKKSLDKRKNNTKKNSPSKSELEGLSESINKSVLNTTNVITQIKGTSVAKDNQIVKYLFNNGSSEQQEEQELETETETETETEIIENSNSSNLLDNDPKYKKIKVQGNNKNRYEHSYDFYEYVLRFEHTSNIEKMLKLTNNSDESSIYKQQIIDLHKPKKISDKKLENLLKEKNKKSYGRFRGDLILALISHLSTTINKTRKLNIIPQLKNRTRKLNIISQLKNKHEDQEDEPIDIVIESIDEQIQNPSIAPIQEPFIEEEPSEKPSEEPSEERSEEPSEERSEEPSEESTINIDTPPLPNNIIEINQEEEKMQQNIGIPDDNDIDSKAYNAFLFNKEKAENEYLNSSNANDFDFLYPELNDPYFNYKIAKRKEFNDTKFDGTIYDIKEQAEKMCKAEFELLPHQLFVKNFLSYQTPYNCLLLYHMLGSGKTCSAIGVAEEMRSYMKQIGLIQKNKRILIVASPNVQNNFRLQLFDDRKLNNENGLWNLETCIGNSLLNEINPSAMNKLNRNEIIKEINNLIKTYYQFVGYDKLANIIRSETKDQDIEKEPTKEQRELEIKKIRQFFNNRLIIIDEVHNITLAQENKEAKKVGSMLMRIARYAQNIRLLLLSATPVYNNYKEIVWLTNLMNAVDKRSSIKSEDVFDKDGNFIKERTTKDGLKLEGGRELLKRKLTGYVSYVRGENPYTFPFRIYPDTFSPDSTFMDTNENLKYPTLQMNLKPIEKPLQHLPIFLNPIGEYQEKAYKFIMDNLRNKSFNTFNVHGEEREMPTFENMESFGYTHLQQPLESLNIIFPNLDFKDDQIVIKDENAENPSKETPPQEKPTEEKPTEEKPTEEPPPQETPPQEKPTEEKPTEEKPTEEKPTEEKPTEEESTFQNITNSIGKTLGIIKGGDQDSIETRSSSDDSSVEFEIQKNTEIIKNMTGKTGLSNIMTYETISESYELRKNFEYKPKILEKYGRIFHPDNINKYSGKIGNLSKIIRNSEGIIIIYSQYIDGGIVPLALMLEEMGFTRYGFASHTTSLLKTPPESNKMLDSITMKTKEEFFKAKQAGETYRGKELGDFLQARYVMITGDKTFSPNNLADIKYVTNKNNMNGGNVKVILISQAAAEGLDFKNIRQVHILSPWYNLNRLEQIIGRGVRNLSHCDLPFEKRNVEIYLHSTIPKNNEEPADLYLYRYSENKAIQIGEITRLMKEIAVDCLLNISQTNLTVDKLLENAANQKIKIQLSSKEDEIEYKVGDKPFTDICDYKDNCNFVCSPNVEIGDDEISKSTYSIDYLKTNYSIIIKRIRQLFREQFFYNREQLINSINILRKYPDEQIDYVLSRFVNNDNETLVDKYGRIGYLINNDNNYIFQPIEITDERSSLFDRSVPIDKKNVFLKMEIDKNKKTNQPLEKIGEKINQNEDLGTKYEKIINRLEEQFEIIKVEKQNALNKEKLIEDENDWYVHCGRVYSILTNENIHYVPPEQVNKYIIYHFLDTLPSEYRIVLINYLYNSEEVEILKPLNDNEKIINQYFDEKTVERDGKKGVFLEVNKKLALLVQNKETKEWINAKPSEIMFFQSTIQKKFEIARTNINNFVGFMHNFKNEGAVFKTKDLSEKRNNIGLKCSGSTKNDTIKRLNRVLESGPFFEDGGERNIYNDNTSMEIKKTGFCVMLEIIMRYYNEIEMEKNPLVKKTWFFDVEKTIYNNLVNL